MHELFSRYIKDYQKSRNFISILILSRTIIYFVTKHIAIPPHLIQPIYKGKRFLKFINWNHFIYNMCNVWLIYTRDMNVWLSIYIYIFIFYLQMSLLQCICFMAVFSTLGRCIFFYLKIKLFLFNMIMCIIPQVQEIHSQLKKICNLSKF